MIDELTKEKNQLGTTVEDLRKKLNKGIATQQEIEAQRDSALQSISQVSMWIYGDYRQKTRLLNLI